MSTYEERYTLQERYEHLKVAERETTLQLRRYTRALGRVLGPQTCPKCGKTLLFFPEPCVADPFHLILYACPTLDERWKGSSSTHYAISDFTEEMVGKDVPVKGRAYMYMYQKLSGCIRLTQPTAKEYAQ